MKRKFRIRFSIILVVIILPAQLLFSSNLDEKPVIKIHYFGHSSFVLQFDNGITLVTDYEIYENESVEPVRVISLKPSEFILQSTNINEALKPSSFNLSNNYPNPFNPTTNIRYRIPHQTEVRIRIFDVLGNEIFTLVDEIKPTGKYETTFEAGGLSSGAYFYQLSCEEFTQTKKMMLVR